MTTPQWTDPDLQHAIELAWQTGRDYQQTLIDEAADDAHHASTGPPTLTHEQRVQNRMADMLRSTPPHEYRGGPVPWEGAPSHVPAWALDAADHNRQRDHTTITAALTARPVWADNDWPAVHAALTSSEWWRIWWDLADTTRARHPTLEPTAATLLGRRT